MAVELQIEKLIYGGDGLARQDGKSVFVPFALPGERVAATLTEDRRSFARAAVDKVLQASADRVVAPCPYFGRCGGCHYQHASYEAQLDFKRGILIESLKRTAGIDLKVPVEVIASPEPYGYRNRTRVHLQHTPKFSLGYYRSGTHELLAVEHCSISSPLINMAIQALWDIGNHGGIPRAVKEIEIFAEEQDAECLIELYAGGERPNADELDRFAQSVQRALPECVGIHAFAQSTTAGAPTRAPVMQQIASAGEPALDYHAAGNTYQVSAGSFFQVNRHLLSQFVSLVTHGSQGRRALDLYAGAGLFALPLSDSYQEVFAVEASPFSFSDLQANLPETARTYCQTTESFLKHRGEEVLASDLAIVDPPRAGIGVEAVKLLASTLPAEIRYVSCDPVTLARDLKVLLDSGYRIEEVYMVDMFPQTMHVESFVRLRSRGRG